MAFDQERHFLQVGVTSQESLLGALQPLLIALPLPPKRALLHYLLLADDERCAGTHGDGTCNRQRAGDVQREGTLHARSDEEEVAQHGLLKDLGDSGSASDAFLPVSDGKGDLAAAHGALLGGGGPSGDSQALESISAVLCQIQIRVDSATDLLRTSAAGIL